MREGEGGENEHRWFVRVEAEGCGGPITRRVQYDSFRCMQHHEGAVFYLWDIEVLFTIMTLSRPAQELS